MGSGVVYGVIVALWAVVLVPMWIRRHDSANETRSADRFSHAMRTLSPRPTTSHLDRVMPARPSTATQPIVTGNGDPRLAARRRLARRRRRVLLALAATVAVLGVVAAFGVVPWFAVVVPLLLLVLYVVNLRVQAKRSTVTRRAADRAQASTAARRNRTPAPPVAADSSVVVETKGRHRLWHSISLSHQTQEGQPEVPRMAQPPVPATAVAAGPLVVDHLVTERLAAGPSASDVETAAAATGTWQPADLPLPTYVTAPKAVRPVRVIDLTSPGAWTSGRFLDDAIPEVDEAVASAEGAADELDALLERRPAVND